MPAFNLSKLYKKNLNTSRQAKPRALFLFCIAAFAVLLLASPCIVPAQASLPTANLSTANLPLANQPVAETIGEHATAATEKIADAAQSVAQVAADTTTQTAEAAAAVAQHKFQQDPLFWTYVVGTIVALICAFAFDLARPGSLARAGSRGVANIPAYIWFICAFVCLASMMLGTTAAVSLPLGFTKPYTDIRELALMSLFGFGFGLIVAIGLARLLAIAEPNSGFTLDSRSFVQGVLGTLLVFPIVGLVGILGALIHTRLGYSVNPISHQTLQVFHDNPNNVWAWVMIATAVLIVPILEEIIYRGMLQSMFLRVFNAPWIAILLTSIPFALMHSIGGTGMPWYAILSLFTFSIGLGIAFERTKRIGVPIIMHALFNAANVGFTMLMSK